MKSVQNSDNTQLDTKLAAIRAEIWAYAQGCDGDSTSLLSLLRTLELVHREIREQMFESSLPQTRNDLYHFVREIEDQGGWPYIERMKLRELLHYLIPQDSVIDQ